MDLFKADFYANNRLKLKTLFTGTAPIILTANGLIQKNSDITYPFRQDSSFWYFTGLNEPGLILVMDKEKDYLILPSRPEHSDLFEGPIDTELLALASGIQTIFDAQEGWRRLTNRLKRSKHAAILAAPHTYIEEYGFFSNPARGTLNNRIKEINDEISFLDIRNHIVKLRSVKQPQEVEALQHAIDLTSDILKKIKKNLSRYEYESDVEAEIADYFKRHNVKDAYPSIIASGKNACIIHYEKYDAKLNENEFLLLDIGAEFDYYSADITRVFGNIDKLSKRRKNIFDGVLDVQNYAFSILKSGVVLKDYEAQIEHYMGEKLRELGLIKTIDRESVRKYFPTLTSHFLGLDTHDVGDYTLPLEEGMVITVEPGIYVPEEGIGVRLEDDVIITNEGIKNLSVNLPSSYN